MAKKEYPAWHYFLAAALAAAIGLTYVVSMFHIILGPGMLLVAGAFFALGMKRRKAEHPIANR